MDDLEIAIAAARTGGAIIAESFGTPPPPDYKGKFDPVTSVDREAEEAIGAVLARYVPDDQIMAEEGGGTRHAGRHWIVDPLDGTVNFVHSIPQVSVSVALYTGDEALVGVVFDPLRDELFTAKTGGGAHLNGHPIHVSVTEELEKSVIATGFPYDHDVKADELAAVLKDVLRKVNGLRRYGSAALDLAWVAAGRFDGYWELGIAPWDGAAGMLLVNEAGGTVTDPFGNASTPSNGLVVATNARIHDDMLNTLASSMRATSAWS